MKTKLLGFSFFFCYMLYINLVCYIFFIDTHIFLLKNKIGFGFVLHVFPHTSTHINFYMDL